VARTLEQLYAEIRRLPLDQQRHLCERLQRDLAAVPAPEPAPTLPARPSRVRPAAPTVPCLLIDGCNVLGTLPDFDLASAEDHRRLLFLLQDYSRQHPRWRIVLFLDAKRGHHTNHGAITVRHVAGRPADDSIIEFLDELPAPARRRARVVTADGELARRARALGADVEPPTAFYRRIARTDTETDLRERPPTPDEVKKWKDYFGVRSDPTPES